MSPPPALAQHMELGAKGVQELQRKQAAAQAAAAKAAAAPQRPPVDPKEELIDQLVLEVRSRIALKKKGGGGETVCDLGNVQFSHKQHLCEKYYYSPL